MTYKCVIFDLDGTLVHTRPEYRYDVLGKTLEKFGKSSSKNEIDRFWFEGNRDKIIRECFGLGIDDFWETFRECDAVESRKKFIEAYDDVDFIHKLRKKNFKTGIVTGAPQEIMSMNLEIIGSENFDTIISAYGLNGIEPKPSPDGIERCLATFRLKNSEAVYVGNADEDVGTARNARVFSVLINRREYDFSHLKPDLVINSLYELGSLLSL